MMKFSLSEEQTMLQESVDRFIQDSYSFEFRQKNIATEIGYSEHIWKQFAELGWLGAALPEAYGGIDLGPGATMTIMEAMGKGMVSEPYLTSVIFGGSMLNHFADDSLKSSLLPLLISGQLKISLAYAETGSRYSPDNVSTTAISVNNNGTANNQQFVINGAKGMVLAGHCADKIIVSVRTSGDRRDPYGISLFLIDRDCSGLSFRNYQTYDGLRASEITLDNVTVGSDQLIGQLNHGLSALEEVLDRGIAALCAEALGCMSALFDLTLDYLKTRKQFGRTIGSFQALQYRMVDLYMALENCRSMVIVATESLNGDGKIRRQEISAAKIQINDACHLIGAQGVQMHGAVAITDELAAGHFYKRLAAIASTLGNSDYHLGRFVEKYE